MTEDRKKLLVLGVWLVGAIVLSHLCGDTIFAIGGEGLTVAAGLAYFGLLVLVMQRVA